MKPERIFFICLTALLLFLIGFLYANNGNFKIHSNNENVNLSGGDYFRFVYIGSSTCQFSNNEQTHQWVSSLKEEIAEIALNHSVNFISTGISVDDLPEQGIRFLNQSGSYNEIITGVSNFNLGSIQYASGAASTPQILIIYEQYETNLLGININNLNNAQHIIDTYNGVFEIEEFYQFVKNSTEEEVFASFDIQPMNPK